MVRPGGRRKTSKAASATVRLEARRAAHPARALHVENAEIADRLDEIANVLEIEGANPFRVRAYRNAARAVRGRAQPLREMVAAGEDLKKLFGIGAGIAKKIEELVRTGRLEYLEELEEHTPRALLALLELPGIGPKRARELRRALGIGSLAQLRAAARAGKVRALPGFGPALEQKLLAALAKPPPGAGRTPWIAAEPVALALVEWMGAEEGVRAVEIAGSFRRRKDTVGDLDVLVGAPSGTRACERFVAFPDVAEVRAKGRTRAAVVLRSGLQVDLRVVEPESFGAALHYFTGSKAHNVAVRRLAQERGLKVNEYGVFRGAERIAGRTEKELYRAVGLPYVEPELREMRGELEAARAGRLPRLVRRSDLRGDLHCHTDASDGRGSIEEVARAAKALGHEYLAITDHTQSARVAGGLDARRMKAHLKRVDEAGRRVRGLRLLRSAEVDVLKDGSLDLPDALLRELDLCVCAVHSHFELSSEAQTSRILRALDHPCVHVLAHPTGRLLGERAPYAVDLEQVVAAAAERGVALELNSQPARLDLDEVWARAAKEAGVRLSIASDAHSPEQLAQIRLGLHQARRAWLEPRDVLNTLPWPRLEKLLRRRR